MVRVYYGLLLLCIAATCCAQHSTPPVDDMIQGEDYFHTRPAHDERFNGHLAHYITMSKITFSNLRLAKSALHDIRGGVRTFLDYAKDLSIDNAKNGRQNPELQNGDLGLITYDLLEEELAEVAFDIRHPITKSSNEILGPICSPSGCSLMAVFSRFRKSFFSDAWWEAEQYCREHDMKYSELLQRLGTDGMSLVATVIWPHEHVVYKKLKLRQLKADLKRLNDVDPSTVVNVPAVTGKRGDMSAHDQLMKRRNKLFSLMDPDTLSKHTEIYAMSIEQMVKRGLVQASLVEEADALVVADDIAAKADLERVFGKVEGSKIITNKKILQQIVDDMDCETSNTEQCGSKLPTTVDEGEF